MIPWSNVAHVVVPIPAQGRREIDNRLFGCAYNPAHRRQNFTRLRSRLYLWGGNHRGNLVGIQAIPRLLSSRFNKTHKPTGASIRIATTEAASRFLPKRPFLQIATDGPEPGYTCGVSSATKMISVVDVPAGTPLPQDADDRSCTVAG